MKAIVVAVFVAVLLALTPRPAAAHCDQLDGPVVTAAREALKTGNVDLVLIWVQRRDEPEIRAAFKQALAVRKHGTDARELADRYFFETVVRVHRAGEGAPFTGLKPAGRDLGPAIPAADRALQTKNPDALVDLLTARVGDGVRARFKDTLARKNFRPGDVEAGRAFVASYVIFIHHVEAIYEAASRKPEGHYPEPAASTPREHREH